MGSIIPLVMLEKLSCRDSVTHPVPYLVTQSGLNPDQPDSNPGVSSSATVFSCFKVLSPSENLAKGYFPLFYFLEQENLETSLLGFQALDVYRIQHVSF